MMLAVNFGLLQDEICLLRAKNYCSLPPLGPAISVICTFTSQRNAGLQTEQSTFGGGNW